MSKPPNDSATEDDREKLRANWQASFAAKAEHQAAAEPEPGAASAPDQGDQAQTTEATEAAGSDPHPDLTAARAVLAPLQADHHRLTAELAEQQEAARLGVPSAIEEAAKLQAALEKLKAPLAAARKAVTKIEAAQAEDARRRAEEAERERTFAHARHARAYREQAATVETLGRQWAQALRDQIAIGGLLGATIGTDDARRLFSEHNILSRVRESMAPVFVIKEGRADRLLPWPTNPASSFGRAAFGAVELQSLASAVRVFDNRNDAETIRARLDPAGADWHILPHAISGLFHLVHAPLRGKARAAALASRAAAAPATEKE